MSSLVSCAECARHVRATEVACPFCGAALESGVARPAPPFPIDRALGRAAVVFMGATALVACGRTTGGKGTAPDPAPTELVAPAYGPPPISDSVPEGPAERVPPLVKVDAGVNPDDAASPHHKPAPSSTATAPKEKKVP